jgi:hypothetical protein
MIQITIFSPIGVKHQKGKRLKEVQAPHELLVVLRLLVIIGLLFIIIIIIVGRSMRGTDAKISQLSRSQWDIGVGDGWVDRHVRELKKWLISLTVDNLLVASNDLNALLHMRCSICDAPYALICAAAHGEDTMKHLQETGVLRGGRGTTAAGSVRRRHNWRRRSSVVSPWILGNNGAKWLMCDILVKSLMCHHLSHALNVGSKSTRSLRVGGNVSYLIHDVLKYIKLLMLHERIK